MKKQILLLALLLIHLFAYSQAIPEGGIDILGGDKYNKLFKELVKNGKMDWEMNSVKDNPKIKSVLLLTTITAPNDISDIQLIAPNKEAIAEGDNILISFYGRKISTANDKDAAHIGCAFEKIGSDGNKSVHHFTELTKDWKQYFFPFKSLTAFKAGEAQICFQIGTKPQSIEIANIVVLNFKQKITEAQLPSSVKVEAKDAGNMKVINDAASKVLGPYPMNGTKTKLAVSGSADIKKIKTEKQLFSEAFQIKVISSGTTAEEVQLTAPNILKVSEGDVLLVSFKARVVPEGKKRPASDLLCTYESSKAPVNRSLEENIPLDTSWRDFSYPFVSKETYENGASVLSFSCGKQTQTIEIAEIQVLNYRKNIVVDKLTRSKHKTAAQLENAGTEKLPMGKDPLQNLMVMTLNAKATGQKTQVTGQEFGECYQITATTTSEHAKDIQCFASNDVVIKKGDVLVLSFYVRSPTAKESAQESISCNFGKATPNYDKSLSKRITISQKWELHTIAFIAHQDFAPNEAHLSFYIGSHTTVQSAEIGKLQLTNYKKSKKVTDF